MIQIVWVAKEYEWKGGSNANLHYVGIVEAHFAGPRDECLRWIQLKPILPEGARNVERDMSAIVQIESNRAQTAAIDFSWLITNEIQEAVVNDYIKELPRFLFVLDPDQERIITQKPPLLLESRSGTGKTNVLFQHAISYSRGSSNSSIQKKPIVFVTVSQRLCRELEKRYTEIGAIKKVKLPEIHFFSFHTLLDFLLLSYHITGKSVASTCSFLEYVHSRKSRKGGKSYSRLSEDLSLIENEIGGVIAGSLLAAKQKAPLNLEQYQSEIRSNVKNDSEDGKGLRDRVYAEYSRYEEWKKDTGKHDINDIILLLVREGSANEIFQSGTYQSLLRLFVYLLTP
jgi:hypothetical protein